MSFYYVTTPIYYVNSGPHIGHAYTSILADAAARLNRLLGNKVKFLTGTDEHGLKIEQAASSINQSCEDFTNQISELFRSLMKSYNISNDDFIRTTEKRHMQSVEKVWNLLDSSGNIYLGKYSGWYCIREETFFQKSELTSDLLSPSGSPVEWIEEESYFFALSKWQDKLLEFYDANPDFIHPKSRTSEVINFVKGGLKDLSISRTTCSWGIKVPQDAKHTIYVWLDALTNYISAIGYGLAQSKEFDQFWPANAHVIGKDILKFHAVYWPAFLMALNLPLPKNLIVHGWLMKDGKKMSKSLGNVIDPIKLTDTFGTDSVRYFLLREISIGNDGNISKAALVKRINHELADKIGNLVQRTFAFARKNFDSCVPQIKDEINLSLDPLIIESGNVLMEVKTSAKTMQFNSALEQIVELANKVNRHIESSAPWKAIKSRQLDAQYSIYIALEIIRHIGIYLQPFVPESACKILNQLSVPLNQRMLHHATKEFALAQGQKLLSEEIIFKKADLENIYL